MIYFSVDSGGLAGGPGGPTHSPDKTFALYAWAKRLINFLEECQETYS